MKQLIKISQVKSNPNNPRLIKNDKFKKLVKSVQEFPEMLELRPIVVDENMIVLGGNMRLKACIEAGLKEVWIEVANLTEQQKKEFTIKDNVGFGEWEWDMLANEWEQTELEDWGLDGFPFEDKVLEAEEDNFEVPDEIKTDIVLGDLFEIGEHRLLCGDSTDSDAVAKLMNGEKAELLFTSPPYSDMREYNGEKDLSIDNLIEFIPSWMPFSEYQVVNLGIQRKDNNIVPYWNDYIKKAKECGYYFLSWNIWDRINSGTMAQQTAMFGIVHEWIFVFGKSPKKLNRTLDNKHQDGGIRKKKKVRQSDGTHMETTAMFYDKKQLNTIITCKYETGSIRSLHPATFPVELPSEYIKAMTNENQVISEPFTGSGTTMVASHQLKRKCYGMELDPKYCQVIIDRMRKLDPNLVIKRNGINIE
jgi:DNA modification methylase